MTRPVNPYLLSRIHGKDAFNYVYRHVSEKISTGSTPSHEIESLRIFADAMIEENIPVPDLDGFFFGYKIPQIGKEFDLLKFREGAVLSIELKSQPVPLAQIRAQLLRNRHYLSHLNREMLLFTFVSDIRQCYRLTKDDVLAPASVSDLAKAVQSFTKSDVAEIDGMFRASEYIVSPAGTPQKFLDHAYFLTQAQDQIRNNLLDALRKTTGLAWFSLTGKPGTGKTLLLYDVGRSLAEEASTLILHWGELTEGHHVINAAKTGLTILPWAVLEDVDASRSAAALAPYSYVLVDESHRLNPRQFQTICQTAADYRQRVVFCLDPDQVLTTAERRNNIEKCVNDLPLTGAFLLSEHLRGNRQLQAFIQEVRDLGCPPKSHIAYRDVDLGYAATIAEARQQLAYYRDRGYVFINYYRAPGRILPSEGAAPADPLTAADAANPPSVPINPFAEFEGGYDIHHIIGQEFDRVVLLLDQSFYYTDDGRLEGIPAPDPDILYPNLFYQSITRVQEKLALIVLENEPLFDRIAAILE